MQREIPRLHSVMAVKSKRIGELENVLREMKETFSKEYDRLRQENERMKQSFMAKLKEKERESEWRVSTICSAVHTHTHTHTHIHTYTYSVVFVPPVYARSCVYLHDIVCIVCCVCVWSTLSLLHCQLRWQSKHGRVGPSHPQ